MRFPNRTGLSKSGVKLKIFLKLNALALRQILLTKSIKSAILYPSRWQTYRASLLGDVSASHSIGDKSVICDNQQIVLKNNRESEQPRYSLFTVRDAENTMIAFNIFAIAVAVGIFLSEIVLKRNSIVSGLSAVVVNVSSILSAATLLTLLLEGFDIMFFRRTREERAKLREERKQFKQEKEQFEKEKEQFEEHRKSVEVQDSKPDNKSSTKPADSEDVEPDS